MATSDSDRLDRLEWRVARLEQVITSATAAVPAAPPPVARPAQPVATPAAAPMTATPASPGPGAPMWAATAPSVAKAPFSFTDLEEQLSGRLLAWVGGIALVIGGAFFLSLAFSRGWVGPEARVVIGLAAAGAALIGGGWLFQRGNGTPALVLVGVGLTTGTLALYAASQLYGFVSPEIALAGSLFLALSAAAIAIREDSRAVAALGLLAATASPPVMGASPGLVTVLFLGTVLVGTAAVSAWRSWSWLPGLAFLMTAPQLASWLPDERSLPLALAVLAGYWLVNAVGAAGTAIRKPQPVVHIGSALLLVSSALFAVYEIREILVAESPQVRALALVVLAGAHAVLAAPMLLRSSAREPFGLLAAAAGIGTVVILIGLEVGGVYQPIAWTAVALGLAFVAIRFSRVDAAAGAAVVASLAVLHLALVEYPVWELGRFVEPPPGLPFTSPEAIVAWILAGSSVVVGLAAARWVRRPAGPSPEAWATAGCLGALAIVAYAVPFELAPAAIVVAWAGLAIVAFGLGWAARSSANAIAGGYAAGWILAGIAGVEALLVVAPLDRLAVDPYAVSVATPVLNEAVAGLAALAATLVVGIAIARRLNGVDYTALGSPRGWVAPMVFAAAAVVTYLGSISVVDAFAVRVSGTGSLPDTELATQAQVALTIAWVVAGALGFAVGIARDLILVRVSGLALLSLATAKGFLVDLATVEVAYRVLSFIGLGLVLLASSFLATNRRRGRHEGSESGASS